MPWLTLTGGIRAHIKVARRPRRRCSVPGCANFATHQCDYLLRAGRTCDAHICGDHAKSVGPDLDHCPTHAGAQSGLFTELTP